LLSQFNFRIEYQPGTENFLADYLSRIHEGNPSSTDITLRDPTSRGSKTDALPDTAALSIDTHYTSSLDYPTGSEDAMYYTSDEKPSPNLTSDNSSLRSSPKYLMNEAASFAVTRSQTSKNPSNERKNPPQSSPSTSPTDSADSYWEDSVISPSPSEQEKEHSETSWRSCTNDDCELHSEEKAEASYWPKDPRKRKESKKAKGKRAAIQGPIAPQKALSYSPPDLRYLSERAPPLRMEDSLLDSPPMAAPAFGPLYNDPDDNQTESSQAQFILDTLNARLHGIFRDRIRQALELDPLYAKVKETGNKLNYSISDGLLLAQKTNSYQNLYIPMGPLDEGGSLRDFILQSVHEGLCHFSANKCYSYAACFFWWPQMRQDFVLYCRSCDKCQINNEPTTLPLGKALSLPAPDEAYQSLAIDFAGPFNKSNGYTTIMVIMDRFTSYTHLVPLKDAATSEKVFDELKKAVFDIHGLPLSIVLDQDSRFTSKFWSQIMKSLNIQVWMATQYDHQTNGQVERRICTLKQMMRNFINKRQNNWCPALPAIAAAMNGAPHDSLPLSPYQALYGRPWKIFHPIQRSASKIPAVNEILNAHEAT